MILGDRVASAVLFALWLVIGTELWPGGGPLTLVFTPRVSGILAGILAVPPAFLLGLLARLFHLS